MNLNLNDKVVKVIDEQEGIVVGVDVLDHRRCGVVVDVSLVEDLLVVRPGVDEREDAKATGGQCAQ